MTEVHAHGAAKRARHRFWPSESDRGCGRWVDRFCGDCALNEERQALDHDVGYAPTALCLSGGGIRSAAFCLGVVQVLARRDMLQEFDYLSTVSGGGFVGGWLIRGLAALSEGRKKENTTPDEKAKARKAFFKEVADANSDRVARLRRFTNYLTPRPGLASVDTWTGLLLWVRNTVVNWAVILPLSVAFAAVPVTWFALTCGLAGGEPWKCFFREALGAIGLLLFGVMVFRTLVEAPSHSHPDKDWSETKPSAFGSCEGRIFRSVVAPAFFWCLLATLAATPSSESPTTAYEVSAVFPSRMVPTRELLHDHAPSPIWNDAWWTPLQIHRLRSSALLPGLAWFTSLVAYGAAYIWVAWCFEYRQKAPAEGRLTTLYANLRKLGQTADAKGEENRIKHRRTFASNLIPWFISNLVSCLLLFAGMVAARQASPLALAFAGPLWVAATEVVRSTCYVALRQEPLRGELDREWLARLNATKLILVATAMAVGCAAVILPAVLGTPSLAAGLVATGPISALLGKSARTSLDPFKVVTGAKAHLGPVLAGTAVVFAILLLATCGSLVASFGWRAGNASAFLTIGPYFATAFVALLAAAVATAVASSLARRVDLGNFSMHAVYRNRLVRAFLGTARPPEHARPDLYTGFDPNDDTRVAKTFKAEPPKAEWPKLFPVINIAANATTGADPARAERKAASFTVTPLRCGWFSPALKTAPTYVATKDFDGRERESGPGDDQSGIMLGRAIALSGAAVSPNMGYHSSPLVAFVMTLFNVRLGAWLPNPACELERMEMRDGRKANEVFLLLRELFGFSDLQSDYIYLSDGGHFDNLGLYEMLRRRCRLILVIDAAQDRTYSFEDLGRTLTKAFVDLDVRVDLERAIDVGNRTAPVKGELAKITYPPLKEELGGGNAATRPASEGYLLYMKPWLPDGTPVEIKAYKARMESFPHEGTANQFFAEGDFESYRRLGEHLAFEVLKSADARISSAGGEIIGLDGLFKVLASMAKGASTTKAV